MVLVEDAANMAKVVSAKLTRLTRLTRLAVLWLLGNVPLKDPSWGSTISAQNYQMMSMSVPSVLLLLVLQICS